MTSFLSKPEPEPKPESSDALLRRTICVSPEMTRSLDMLVDMHTYRRPSRSKTERKFINKFIVPTGATADKYGNYFLAVPNKNGTISEILWSSHTDTVHSKKGIQQIGYDKNEIGLTDRAIKEGSNCLGADDTVGVWIMLEMIREAVPGCYLFHREEEGGRKGSMWLAKNYPELLGKFKTAIALDRKGESSIITHQMGMRCCSDDFQKSLTASLTGLDYKGDDGGSYTDTASYVDVIGECTNLSVGYRGAHSDGERLDITHAFKLRDALILMDQSKLEFKRKPGAKEPRVFRWNNDAAVNRYHNGYYDDYADFDDKFMGGFNGVHHTPNYNNGAAYGSKESMKGTDSGKRVGTGVSKLRNELDTIVQHSRQSMLLNNDTDDDEFSWEAEREACLKLVKANPDAIVEILDAYGIGFNELCDEIQSICGTVNC